MGGTQPDLSLSRGLWGCWVSQEREASPRTLFGKRKGSGFYLYMHMQSYRMYNVSHKRGGGSQLDEPELA